MSPPGPRQGVVQNQEFSQSAVSQKRGYQVVQQQMDAHPPIGSDLPQHRPAKRTYHQQVSLGTQAQLRSQSLGAHASAPAVNVSKMPDLVPVMQDGTVVWQFRR